MQNTDIFTNTVSIRQKIILFMIQTSILYIILNSKNNWYDIRKSNSEK